MLYLVVHSFINYALCLLVGAELGERNVAALIVIFVDFVID